MSLFKGIICILLLQACLSHQLWDTYFNVLKQSKYIDLTHAFEPQQAVWDGFGRAKFSAAKAGQNMEGYISIGETFEYGQHGFAATSYEIPTDQYGT